MHYRLIFVGFLVCGCSGDDAGGSGTDGSGTEGASSTSTAGSVTSPTPMTTVPTTSAGVSSDDAPSDTMADADTTSLTDGATEGEDSSSDGGTTGPLSNCDYETVDGMIVIEAESLPIVDEWVVSMAEPGFYGDGYIDWTGASSNGTPGNGEMTVTLYFGAPGRYRLQWRNRIGEGNNTTEHNDTWVSFPDVDGFFGRRDDDEDERRVYPRPLCEDADAMSAITDMDGVTTAGCPSGTSADGWFKVYSSGASDWSWSAFTSDNDAHEVVVEIAAAGDYTMMLSARADRHLLDRLVIHDVALDDAVVRAEENVETACR
ncbi:MAG: hypothetical protein JKY37_06470 [Nannocystaceae bacterium]|nr:hypothetical protein [Nannocystaceae bacterium]